MTMRRDQNLVDLRFFSDLTGKQMARVSRLMTPIDVGAGRVLIRQGTFGREFFVVVDGLATVSKDGRPVTLMRPGDHFGEIALLYNVTRTATVQAISAMTIAVWEQRDFKEMLEIAPRVRGQVRHSIARIRRREPESFAGAVSSSRLTR